MQGSRGGLRAQFPPCLGAVPVVGSLQPWEVSEGWGWDVLGAVHRTAEQLWGDFSQHSELLHKGRAWNSMSTLQLSSAAL